jgi:hypothetical protein
MDKPFTVNQGRPISRFFTIAIPYPGSAPAFGTQVICRNRKNNTQITAVCRDYFTYHWKELPNSFCKLQYGVETSRLREELEKKFPEFQGKEQVRFLLLEEIGDGLH